MKKVLAIILSLVLAFILVTFAACISIDGVDQADANQSNQSNQSEQPQPSDKNEQSDNQQQTPSEKDDRQEYPEDNVGGDLFIPIDLSNFVTRAIFVNTLVAAIDFDKLDLDAKDVAEAINGFIDDVLLRYDVAVAFSAVDGFALRFTLSGQSLAAIIDDAFSDEQPSTKDALKGAFAEDSTFELIVRFDADGSFSSASLKSL